MTTPPPPIESLLEALGAEPRFRESVIGDLAEEFASRAERDGLQSARQWYRREAMRATPHLLRSGWRVVRRRGLGRLLGIMLTAFTGMVIVERVIAGSVIGALRSEVWHTSRRLYVSYPVWQVSMVALNTLSATFAGCIAAWLDHDAPLFTAIALGIVWSVLEVVGLQITGGPLPEWCRLVIPLAILAGTAMGGVLRVHQRTRDGASGIRDT